ncbi:MAG: ATPase [Chloroflexi bacterium RBG_13_56_8]|nr:MAG: ATPase [Chloroflexi bacterium RBG_13_56_8]
MEIPRKAIRAERGGSNPLGELDSYLHQHIFGQERAIESIIRALNRGRYRFAAGRNDRPIAVLLFLGPTGVGKSETAKRLASYLHPEGGGFLKIDCSLFSHGHEISALVGAPPAFVGREQRPLFDPEIIENPNSVILFDEVEKASTEFRHLMLQVMEEGEVTLLNGGQRVVFRESVIIMTTNAGAREMGDYIQGRRLGFSSRREATESMGASIFNIGFSALQKAFTPEWLNRIDEMVAFRPLSFETLVQILDHMLSEANQRYEECGVRVHVTSDAKELMLHKGFAPEFGARPLRARLMKEIEAPLADLLASGGIPKGSEIWVDATGEPEFGKELAFYYLRDEGLLQLAEQRQTEEGVDQPLEAMEVAAGGNGSNIPQILDQGTDD